eukprot:maker-scaffold_27-snap-gene-1.19-mRNA-1 protein AED:0.01 eAED:0.01 QI:102/1/1/1/1/1/3/250/388
MESYRSNLLIIGLTGGIAAGKSTVLKYLVEKGFAIVEADKLGHEAYLPGTKCFQDLVDHFGDRIVAADGTINRKELGSIIFSDSVQMEKLNEIVWPAISALAQQQLNEISKNFSKIENPSILSKIVVLEAAILIEAGWSHLVDEVWLVCASEETQTSRLIARNKLSCTEAKTRISSQLNATERKQNSHVLITNNKDEAHLFSLVDKELESLRQRYSSSNSFEFVPIVEKSTDKFIRPIRRGAMSYFHLCSRCCYVVIKVENNYLVQKRSLSKSHAPGLIDPAPGGYNEVKEDYKLSAIREIKEELGLDISGQVLQQEGVKFFFDAETPNWGTVFQVNISIKDYENIKIDKSEVHSVFLLSRNEILRQSENHPEKFLRDGLQAFKLATH